jgi:cellulose synthase/poly-beta-1,6-N-acetylglucosamine synthase-like glycosyltransferase
VDDFIRLRRIEYLLGTLLSLVVADGIISQFLIKSGIGQEGNPFLKTLVAEGNFLIVKMCGAIICVIILWNMAKRLPKLVFIVSVSLVSIYTAILFWNIAVFLAFGA